MDKILIISFSFIFLIAGVTSVILKKALVSQYINLKNGLPKGSFISAMFRQPFSNGGGFESTLKEMSMFPLLRPVVIDNTSADLTNITRNIRTIHYVTYIVIVGAIILGLLAGKLYPNGFETTM